MEANYFIVLFTLGLFLLQDTAVAQETINVNMNGKGCDNPDGYVVNDNQIYSLYYDYSPQIQGSRDHCDVSLRTSLTIRRLKYYVTTLDLLDCGVEILVYYNPSISATPTRKLSCNDDKKLPISETSNFNALKFSLRKTTSQANTIRILIRVTTDNGPDIGLVKGESEFYETPLQPGAIAGIAIAGAIIVVALIGLAIYCCIRNRRENLKHVEASGAPSASSVFTSGTSQNMFPANNKRSRGSYGSMEDVRSTTTSSTGKNANAYSNKGYKIDGDEKSTNNYYNKGYKADSDEKKPHRQNSYSRRDKNQGGHLNEAYEQSDVSADGTDFSRGESGRALKYAKNKQYSRTEEYQMSKVNKMPVNGILKTRSKSPNRSQSSTESSTDNNALVYGYSHSSSAHPNTQHIVTVEKTRSRSHSRGSRSVRSGSTGSQGRSSSASRATGTSQKILPNDRASCGSADGESTTSATAPIADAFTNESNQEKKQAIPSTETYKAKSEAYQGKNTTASSNEGSKANINQKYVGDVSSKNSKADPDKNANVFSEKQSNNNNMDTRSISSVDNKINPDENKGTYSKKSHKAKQNKPDSQQEKEPSGYVNKTYEDLSTKSKHDHAYSKKGRKAKQVGMKPDSQHKKELAGHVNKACEQSDVSVNSTEISSVEYGSAKQHDEKGPYSPTEMSKRPTSGILKRRSKSPNRSRSSADISLDTNALVYGYSHGSGTNPNTLHIPTIERTRSRSHSVSSGSRSRSSSMSKVSGKDKMLPKTTRQYGDLSNFLNDRGHRSRSHSRSGYRERSGSRTSEKEQKKTTGGKRVHIQGVESDI